MLLSISSPEILFGFVMILLLLISSALISGSEVAFFSLNHNDVERLRQDESTDSSLILQLVGKPKRLLATILIANNFINIAIVILSDFVLQALFSEAVFDRWAAAILALFVTPTLDQIALWGRGISFTVTVVAVTFLLVLFGEVAPKVYARLNNLKLARIMSRPLAILSQLFRPLSNLLVNSSRLLEKRLSNASGNNNASRADIDEAIELTVNQGQINTREIDILKSIVKFGDVVVKQIMCSRVDVVCVDFRIDYPELLGVIRESGYSRIPVYENDFDHVTGILYVKDLLGHLNEPDDFEWQQLIRPDVYYVPETKKISDLLKEFQREHLHIAVVVDEYGGSSGIVTLEDIMEEIIGEIKDEFDDEAELIYRKIDDFNYLFEGKTLLNDLCRVIGIDTNTFDEAKGEADSLAGLLLEVQGQIPKVDTEVLQGQYRFKVVSVNKRRIEQVLVTLPKN